MEILKAVAIGCVGGAISTLAICFLYAVARLRRARRETPYFRPYSFWRDFWETFGPRGGR